MSHDLRSPLNSIVALIDLHDSDRAAFDACGGLARIADLARHALSLGDHFIFSSVEQDLSERDFVRFELRSTVLGTLRQLDVAARYREVSLQSWVPQGAPIWVQGVRTFVARALQNLLDNAVRASPRGTRVTCSLKLEAQQGIITITDQAGGLPGLAPGDVISRFDALARRASGGYGLGLSLASRIVQLHGGSLHAQRNDSGGTDFVLRLPCLNRGSASAGGAPSAGFAAAERSAAQEAAHAYGGTSLHASGR
jgi:signal transduction histidine kinase